MKVPCMLLALALSGCGRGCGPQHAPAPADAGRGAASDTLRAMHADAPPKLDGELTEPAWQSAARTGPFLDPDGQQARPFSEVKATWDETNLYLGLYAADQDIEARVTRHDEPVWTDDAFRIRLGPSGERAPRFAIDVSATGVTADARRRDDGSMDASWESGVRLAVDKDGTVNDPRDEDEEWVVEAAMPFASLGLRPVPGTRLLLEVTRCDTPKGATSRCASWGREQGRTTGVIELRGTAP
ncbi:MAG TPA: carbohydrate-binding family 9-like protein [Minicystis sp.]|nr:carbohydrate-binding family 9-like protein [Minicystis sp.]